MVAFFEPEVTLSRQRAQIERLGLSESLEKICLALSKVEGSLIPSSATTGARGPRRRTHPVCGKDERLSAASLGVGNARAPKIGFAQADQDHGMATQAMHGARLAFGFLQQDDGLVDAIGQTIGMAKRRADQRKHQWKGP